MRAARRKWPRKKGASGRCSGGLAAGPRAGSLDGWRAKVSGVCERNQALSKAKRGGLSFQAFLKGTSVFLKSFAL